MSFYAAFCVWFAGAIVTALWFDRRVHRGDLAKRAQLAVDAMIFAASMFWPPTWVWIAYSRTRRHFAYQRRH